MSFIKKEEESQFGDWIFLVILLLVGLGFYWYYNTTKEKALQNFNKAHSLYENQSWVQALAAYDSLQNSPWKNDSLDSVLYQRHSELNDRAVSQWTLLEELQKLEIAQDTFLLGVRLKQVQGTEFLSIAQLAELKRIQNLKISSDTTKSE
jgi:hypothetical protein